MCARPAGERCWIIELGTLRKWRGTGLGRKHFKTPEGKKCCCFFNTACSIFDIDLLGEFLLWVGGPGRTSHTAPFIVPIKNSSTEPVSGWGIIGTSISDPKAMAPKRAVRRIGDFYMLCRWSYNPLVFPSQHTLCLLRPRDHMQLEQNCTQVARWRRLYTQVRAPWPFLPPSRRECQQSTRPPVIITCKQSQLIHENSGCLAEEQYSTRQS